ncbi:MAG: GNAT family N-acetyltransferase [Rhodospirillaceae bacterium]|nr:GNAT family N-acetyltransferase [Rhodospirillaceae bacterium]
MSSDIRILKSYEDVEPFVDQVRQGADSERDALGFLPLNAYKQAAEQGKILVAVNSDNDFLGHLMFGGVYPHGKVMQIYSTPRYRHLGIAKALIIQLIDYAEEREFLSLSAKVASDLSEANAFYEKMGFQIVSTLPGGKSRERILYRRVRDLDTPSLFNFLKPRPHQRLPSFGLSGGFGTKTPIYSIDLNVLFDVSKQRMRSEEAGMIFKAGFSNEVRPVIAEEFAEELRRTSSNLPSDPHLQLALQMNILPAPKTGNSRNIVSRLAQIIFPERHQLDALTVQDKSDLKHIATAIHHDVAGFITNEKAILRARDQLLSEFHLDVLGVSDFADAMSPGHIDVELDQVARAADSEVVSSELTEKNFSEAKSYLEKLYVPPECLETALSKGDQISPHKHLILNVATSIISFASWSVSYSPRKLASVFLCADELSPIASTVIDHTLNQICREVSSGAPARLRLHILPGHPVTRKVALAHGFRPEPGNEEHGTILHKVAMGHVIDEGSWSKFRSDLKSLANVEVPLNPPAYQDSNQPIRITTAHGLKEVIPLNELETLLSPTLILLPGRHGAVASIRRIFSEELLGTGIQRSFFAKSEAVLLKERVFYSSVVNSTVLAPGTPILFYESAKDGGEGGIVALARSTDTITLALDQIKFKTRRKGVLSAGDFASIGKGDTKLVTTIDSIMVFKQPISFARLRDIGCTDGANFFKARRIDPNHLNIVISEGKLIG